MAFSGSSTQKVWDNLSLTLLLVIPQSYSHPPGPCSTLHAMVRAGNHKAWERYVKIFFSLSSHRSPGLHWVSLGANYLVQETSWDMSGQEKDRIGFWHATLPLKSSPSPPPVWPGPGHLTCFPLLLSYLFWQGVADCLPQQLQSTH